MSKKTIIKPIFSYFKPQTQDETELKELLANQERRKRSEAAKQVAERCAEIEATVMNHIILKDDEIAVYAVYT